MTTTPEPMTSKMRETDWKYPQSHCTGSDWLTIKDDPPLASPHRIHWAEYGNPAGEPVMFIHGGPGSGCTQVPSCSRFFDPERFRIILFDQRGCGKSEPSAAADNPKPALLNNETSYLIKDIIHLRRELRIRRKMHMFGGSWGSTLAIAYAIKHPETVQTLILRGIFLCRKKDLDYFYQGNAASRQPSDFSVPGTYMFFPEAWKLFLDTIPLDRRKDMIAAYAAEFRRTRNTAVKTWSSWEGNTSYLQQDTSDLGQFAETEFAKAMAMIETHYFLKGGFLDGRDRNQNYILNNVHKIKGVPIHIVQGRYDQVCPMFQAEEFVAALKKADSDLVNYIVTAAGHSAFELENCRALTHIMDSLPRMNPSDMQIDALGTAIKELDDRLTAIERRLPLGEGRPPRSRRRRR